MAQKKREPRPTKPTRKRKTETIPESTVGQPKTKAKASTITPSVVASGRSREPGSSLMNEPSKTKANESKDLSEKKPPKTSGPRVRKPQTECPAIDYDSVVVLGLWNVEYKAAAIGRYAKEVARLLEDGVGVARTAGNEVDLLRGAIVDALSQAACRGEDAPLKRGQIGRCYEAILKLMGSDGTFSKSGSAEGLKRLADRLENLAAMPDPAPIEPIVREIRRLAQEGWTNHDHVLLRSAAALYVLLAARGNLGIDQAVRRAMTSLEHLSLGRHNDKPDLGDLIEAAEALRRAHCEKTIDEVLADPAVKSLPARLRRLLQIVDFQQLGSDTRDRLASIHMTMAGLWWTLHEARDRGPIEIWTGLKQRGFDLELLSDLENGHRRLDRIVEGQGTADDRRALLMLADVMDSLMNVGTAKPLVRDREADADASWPLRPGRPECEERYTPNQQDRDLVGSLRGVTGGLPWTPATYPVTRAFLVNAEGYDGEQLDTLDMPNLLKVLRQVASRSIGEARYRLSSRSPRRFVPPNGEYCQYGSLARRAPTGRQQGARPEDIEALHASEGGAKPGDKVAETPVTMINTRGIQSAAAAELGKDASTTTADADQPYEVRLSELGDGKYARLLEDLVNAIIDYPDMGVRVREKRHGVGQPRQLRAKLRDQAKALNKPYYAIIAEAIIKVRKVKNTWRLNVPVRKIRLVK